MPGPTPITAPHRISFFYVTATLTHVVRFYCRLTTSSDPTGHNIVTRAFLGTIGAQLACDRITELLAPLFSAASASFGNFTLEERSGTTWIPLVNTVGAHAPSSGLATALATQQTFFFYSTDRTIHKNVLLENVYAAPGKANTTATVPVAVKNWIDSLNAPGLAEDPGQWVLSRDAAYIGSWLSVVSTLNRKTRRRRSLA